MEPVTLDSMMGEFVCDMVVADDELSDSIWTCVDNYIDDLCLRVMDDENSVFETDRDEGNLPFNYIIDKVLERIDTVDAIADAAYAESLAKSLGVDKSTVDFSSNFMDPDYCEEILFDEITPEEFQLDISVPNVDGDANELDTTWGKDDGTSMTSAYDAIFNA